MVLNQESGTKHIRNSGTHKFERHAFKVLVLLIILIEGLLYARSRKYKNTKERSLLTDFIGKVDYKVLSLILEMHGILKETEEGTDQLPREQSGQPQEGGMHSSILEFKQMLC